MKKIFIIALLTLAYLGGLFLYYENEDRQFIANLQNAIKTGDQSLLNDYATYEIDHEVLTEMDENEFEIFSNVELEWTNLKESVENIKNVTVISQETDYINYIFYFKRVDCYYLYYNDRPELLQYLCNIKDLNETKVTTII